MEEMLLYIFKIPGDRLEPVIFGQMVNSVDMDEIISQAKTKKSMLSFWFYYFYPLACFFFFPRLLIRLGKSKVAVAKQPTANRAISTPRPSNYMNDIYDVASSIVSTILTPRPQVWLG
jgi:hypothetical protein